MVEYKQYPITAISESITSGGDAAKFNCIDSPIGDYTIPVFANATENEGLYGYTNRSVIDEEAVTIAARGAGVGFVAYRKPHFVPIVRLITIVPKQNVANAKYLSYYLRTQNIIGGGAAIPQLTVPMVNKIKVQLPSLEYQCRIVSILSEYDSQIENNQKRIKLLEQMAENLYKEWFVRFRFPGYEDAEFDGGVPKGWRYESFGTLSPIKTGKKDANFSSPTGKYKFFTCSQEALLADNYSFDCFAIILAGNGDFNVKLYDGKFEAYQRTYVLCPYDIKHLFIAYYTIQGELINLLSGAAGAVIKFLTKGMIEKIKVIIPDSKTLEHFFQFCIYNYRERQSLLSQNEILIKQRDLLLPRLMSGKLSVSC